MSISEQRGSEDNDFMPHNMINQRILSLLGPLSDHEMFKAAIHSTTASTTLPSSSFTVPMRLVAK
jgi:hypothetical protein